MNLTIKPCKLLFFFVTLLAAGLKAVDTLALPSDRNQPIYIQSDRAEQDKKKGITIYQGKVQMNQGTLQITADKITIHSINNKMNRIVAKGFPAHFQQIPAEGKKLVVAEGNTIEYLLTKEQLYILERASIKQEGQLMTGERIDYNIKDAVVVAAGDSSDSDQRIHIVIPPQNADETSPLEQE